MICIRLLLTTFFLSLICAQPIVGKPDELFKRAPVAPTDDPFYSPPAGYESQPVGSILRFRKRDNPYGVLIVPAHIKNVYQLLVRSEDSHGNANAIVTTVYEPFNADPKKLLSYQVAEDSASPNCAPSYAFQLGSNINAITTSQLEQIFSQAGLEEGWYVVSPDYEGPKAAFGAGHQAGKAVLNSVRAALASSNITGLHADAKVSYWGYSGGSIATGWAALLEPTYAPELSSNTVGYAYGGIVADVEHTAATNVGTAFAGLIFAAMNGLSAEYPDLNDYINSHLKPGKSSDFRKAATQCLINEIPFYAFASWDQYFVDGKQTLYSDAVTKVTSANNMVKSNLVPTAPLFFYNSVLDEVIPAADANKLYDRLCSSGASIKYEQDLLGGHITQYVLGAGSAFSWLKDRMNGIQADSGCKKLQSFSNLLTPDGIKGFSDITIGAILTLLQKPVGPLII